MTITLQEQRIDVIDLSQSEERVVLALKTACEDVGFFYLTNHGIDQLLIDNVFNESKKFFSLPVTVKEKVLMGESGRGYTAYMGETLDPKSQKSGDTKEGYYIGQEIPDGDPRLSKPLHGPNKWPDPELLPNWRPVMSEYWKRMRQLALDFVPLLALALDLPRDWFNRPGMFDDPIANLRLLHYPPEVSSPEDGIFGCGAHSDYGILTLLALDGASGLQICREKDKKPQLWEDVPPIPGTFVVNLGDCLERWTNNKFRSTLHRVVNPGVERYSVPYFFEPNFDCVVECIPTCCSPENPARYPPITVGEYLLGRYKETHDHFKEAKQA